VVVDHPIGLNRLDHLDVEPRAREEPRGNLGDLQRKNDKAGDVDDLVERNQCAHNKAEFENRFEERLAVVDFQKLKNKGEEAEVIQFFVRELHRSVAGNERMVVSSEKIRVYTKIEKFRTWTGWGDAGIGGPLWFSEGEFGLIKRATWNEPFLDLAKKDEGTIVTYLEMMAMLGYRAYPRPHISSHLDRAIRARISDLVFH
jgi:hypothetical protein